MRREPASFGALQVVGQGAHGLFEVRLVDGETPWRPVAVIVLEMAGHHPEGIEPGPGQCALKAHEVIDDLR